MDAYFVTKKNANEELEREAQSLRKVAIAGVFCSTILTIVAALLIPMLYSYLQYVQIQLEDELDFCTVQTRNLAKEWSTTASLNGIRSKRATGSRGELVLDAQPYPLRHSTFVGQASGIPQRQTRQSKGYDSATSGSSSAKAPASPPPSGYDSATSGTAGSTISSGSVVEESHDESEVCSCGVGQAGPPGPPGEDGQDGKDGESGVDGQPGADALQDTSQMSEPCFDCPEGPPGPAGAPGPKGSNGQPGPNGKDGESGTPGPQGPPGPAGSAGENGQPGEKGAKGPDGVLGDVPGIVGPPGPQGPAGPAGQPGPAGRVGSSSPGPSGPTGDAGAPGPAGKPGAPGGEGVAGDSGVGGGCFHKQLPAAPRRDTSIIGKTVRIKQGLMKGYLGMAKDADHTAVQVELFTLPKNINVQPDRVKVIGSDASSTTNVKKARQRGRRGPKRSKN